jgi:hypothetical protein
VECCLRHTTERRGRVPGGEHLHRRNVHCHGCEVWRLGRARLGLTLSNPAWKWIKDETGYVVTLRAPSGPRTVNMKGGVSDHSLFAFVDKEVINALAMDRGGKVVTVVAANRTLGTFRLDNSRLPFATWCIASALTRRLRLRPCLLIRSRNLNLSHQAAPAFLSPTTTF